jgi:hypothetical protein
VPAHMLCGMCKNVMHDPMQLQTLIDYDMSESCHDRKLFRIDEYGSRMVFISSFEQEVSTITISCTSCDTEMTLLYDSVCEKAHKFKLTDCSGCDAFYPTSTQKVHECYIVEELKNGLAEANEVLARALVALADAESTRLRLEEALADALADAETSKRKLADAELPPAKKQKK